MAHEGWSVVGRCRGHERLVGRFAWSPDSSEVATPGGDGRLVIWNVATREPRFSGQLARGLHAAAWSPSDDVLALVASADAPPSQDSDDDMDVEYPEMAYEDSLLEAFGSSAVREGYVAPPESDGPIFLRLVDAQSGLQIGTLSTPEVTDMPWDLLWRPDGEHLISASSDGLALWHARDGYFLGFFEDSHSTHGACSLGQQGSLISGATANGEVGVWDSADGSLHRTLPSAAPYDPICTAFAPGRNRLAVGHTEGLVQVWDYVGSDLESHELEAHTSDVTSVAFSADGRLLATTSLDGSIGLWDLSTWSLMATRTEASMRQVFGRASFSPSGASEYLALTTDSGRTLMLTSIDVAALAARQKRPRTVHYANAKVVLLGDSGVGKSGLGLVLTGQEFRATDSTHQRNVWLLSSEREAGPLAEQREVYLWDLAGQPGYRLLHQLHLSDSAVAVVVFDARNDLDPFAGVRHWARALREAQQGAERAGQRIRRILVAARVDRGGIKVSDEELRQIRQQFGFDEYVATSAKEGSGVSSLRETIERLLHWEELPKVSSTELFDSIRAFLLAKRDGKVVLATEPELRHAFAATGAASAEAVEAEFRTCIERAEARGLVTRLSFGDLVLLKPEVLDAYGAAVIHAAAAVPDGLGAVREDIIRQGKFDLPPASRLADADSEKLLLLATIEHLLAHEVALREDSDDGVFLVFPTESRQRLDLGSNLRPWQRFEFEGAIQHVWATLVVRLAHSGVFTVEGVGANGASFLYSGRQLAITVRILEEGKGQLELLTGASADSHDEQLMAAFVAKHLCRRAISGSIVASDVEACKKCGFVFSDAMLTALGDAETFFCPSCGTKASTAGVPETSEERIEAPDVRGLELTADDEIARAAARIAVQGKDQIHEFDVFLAHSSKDKPSVRILATALRDVNVNPWLDEDEIPPGRWFQDVIQEVIPRVHAAAVVVGPEGLGRWEALELRTFISHCVTNGLNVIPVILPGAQLPPEALFLKELNAVTFVRTIEEPEPFARLVWGITDDRALYQRLRARRP